MAAKVTGPAADGTYHYEYAFHNRDNARGVSAFRLPICAEASFANAGFRDIDADAGNDWSIVRTATEIVASTATHPLEWNTIYNLWFDSDAAPVSQASLVLDAFLAGPGAPSFSVTATAPTGLYNENLGPGCGLPGVPSLLAAGSPPRALLGNGSFSLRTAGHPAAAPVALFSAALPGITPLGGGCTLYAFDFGAVFPLLAGVADASGEKVWATPIPLDPNLEGATLDLQGGAFVPGGAFLGSFNLTNGLRVRIGNAIAGCP